MLQSFWIANLRPYGNLDLLALVFTGWITGSLKRSK
jgi:hypothetical protein